MYVADLRFDHPVSTNTVQMVTDSVLDQPAGARIQIETHRGDFPYLVRVTLPTFNEAPSIEQFQAMARSLRSVFITDDVAVGELWDDGFSLISPDGFTAVVRVEDDAESTDDLVLLSESKALYRSLAARLPDSAVAD